MRISIIYLSCGSEKEADQIGNVLLDKKLIACFKKLPTQSSYRWKDKVYKEDETLLLLETDGSFFDRIEKEVRKIHSYETFVMLSVPVEKASDGVEDWLQDSLGS